MCSNIFSFKTLSERDNDRSLDVNDTAKPKNNSVNNKNLNNTILVV